MTQAEFDGRYDQLVDEFTDPGLYTFNVPDEMKRGEVRTVTVRIARGGEAPTGLTAAPSAEPTAQRFVTPVPIPTTALMRVRLIGEDFSITDLQPEQQFVDGTGREWQFRIRPKRAGVLSLTLSIDIVLEDGNKERASTVPVDTRRISVEVSLDESIIDWLRDNWQWLVGSAGTIGAAGTFIARKSRRVRDGLKRLSTRPTPN